MVTPAFSLGMTALVLLKAGAVSQDNADNPTKVPSERPVNVRGFAETLESGQPWTSCQD
jgi:hypothetical protein